MWNCDFGRCTFLQRLGVVWCRMENIQQAIPTTKNLVAVINIRKKERDGWRTLPNAKADCASLSLVPRSRLHFKPYMERLRARSLLIAFWTYSGSTGAGTLKKELITPSTHFDDFKQADAFFSSLDPRPHFKNTSYTWPSSVTCRHQ
ncbi:hypothetical protein Zmor_014972 [Zophobas morio]|uniref:Uncharacterized protein n=1 Tax=Zophobas morio TaxID=2755281 RepID=A0AA38IIG4_9CUCU|nr:hypothetical protein Zmor_014972 [Zophobas morio]